MNIRQAFKMAFRSILGNKGRSVLTMLGIIIGIASVMTIVSTINGMGIQVIQWDGEALAAAGTPCTARGTCACLANFSDATSDYHFILLFT